MPKDANILPNLRIDIPDYKQSTSVLGRGFANLQRKLVFQDKAAAAAEGFLVEIANQGASPGLFSIHNGIGYNRDGEIINNEDDVDATRSHTLGGDATYFVEIEYVESESDVDARAFWDPSYSNGSDVEPGREFSQNVSTRLTPDWQIVTPVSTTAFESTADPTSTKIPIAVLTVVAGQISGATTSPLRSMLVDDELIGSTTIRLLNTRAMPQGFTLRLDPGGGNQEDVVVSLNDQENGVLTTAALVAGHFSGERVIVLGGADFLVERVDPVIPTAGTEDARPRFYQADEERGALVGLDPTGTGIDRSDHQVENLKRYVDFLAGQLRELKFGGQAAGEVGVIAPPSSFTTAPRYFESAGGVLGARSNTVSVGDGVSTWGDFNTLQSGSAHAAIQAAIDELPAEGGVVYIKAGYYALTNSSINIGNKPVHLIGDSRDATNIDATGTAAAIEFGGAPPTTQWSSMLRMDNLAVTYSGGFSGTHAISCLPGSARMLANNCLIYGIKATGAFANLGRSIFDHCRIKQVAAAGSALEGRFNECTFNRCYVDTDSGQRAVLIVGTSAKLVFNECTFRPDATAPAMVELAADTDNVVFSSCEFGTGAIAAIALTAAGGSDITLEQCKVLCTGGVNFDGTDGVTLRHCAVSSASLDFDGTGISLEDCALAGTLLFDGCAGVTVRDCTIEVPASGEGLRLGAAASPVTNFKIDNCTFTQASSAPGTTGIGILIDEALGGSIVDCKFPECNHGIQIFDEFKNATIRGCTFGGATTRIGIASGYEPTGCITESIQVLDCVFDGLGSDDLLAAGIYFKTPGAGSHFVTDWVIKGNTFKNIDGGLEEAFGIYLSLISVFCSGGRIEGNSINNVETDKFNFGFMDECRAAGIWMARATNTVIANNVIQDIGNRNISFQEFQGIKIVEANTVVISGNVIQDLGNVNPFKIDRSAAISIGGDSAGTTVIGPAQTGNSSTVAITGNTISGLKSNSNHACIFIWNDVHGLNISGNSMWSSDLSRGIWLESGATNNDKDETISITGNTFDGAWNQCMFIVFGSNATFSEGYISITGNVCDGFTNTGIYVRGTGASPKAMVTISGNTLRSTSSSQIEGIKVEDIRYCSVTGNGILITDNGASNDIGIELDTVSKFAVVGNYMTVGDTGPNVFGIATSNFEGVISGNFVDVVGQGGGGTSFGIHTGLIIGGDVFVSANKILPKAGLTPIFGDNTTADNDILNHP